MKLYMKISADEFELPEAVAGSPGELAEMLGVKKNTVESNIAKQKNDEKPRYMKLEIPT